VARGNEPCWPAPVGVGVDQVTNSIYVANAFSATMSVINANICNRNVSFGCSLVPRVLPTGLHPGVIGVDPATGTLYASGAIEVGQNADFGISVIPL
jgi:DNA-binding beta-propeller fold protein YncE